MASVALEFALPPQPDLVKVYVLESSAAEGPFTVIDTISEVGTYPDYIDNYTTDQAADENNWFSIMWEDAKGAQGDLSQPMQGNTTTLVGLIADRVQQRGATASNEVIIQEAEAVIEQYFGKNPYEVPLPVSFQVLSGLTYVTMARSMISEIAASTTMSDTAGWTAGLVSMKSGASGSTSTQQQFDWLLSMASRLLGIGVSRIAQMATPEIAGGQSKIIEYNISRLLVTEIV